MLWATIGGEDCCWQTRTIQGVMDKTIMCSDNIDIDATIYVVYYKEDLDNIELDICTSAEKCFKDLAT